MCQVSKKSSCLGLNKKAKKKFIDDDLVSGVDPLYTLLVDFLLDNKVIKEEHIGNYLLTIFHKAIDKLVYEISRESSECLGLYNSMYSDYYMTIDAILETEVYVVRIMKRRYSENIQLDKFDDNSIYRAHTPVPYVNNVAKFTISKSKYKNISDQPLQSQAEFLAEMLITQFEKPALIEYRQKLFDYLMDYYKLSK